jgi:hypothetical protein
MFLAPDPSTDDQTFGNLVLIGTKSTSKYLPPSIKFTLLSVTSHLILRTIYFINGLAPFAPSYTYDSQQQKALSNNNVYILRGFNPPDIGRVLILRDQLISL